MSPRAAWRLEAFGYVEVYDYVAGKSDWMAAGLAAVAWTWERTAGRFSIPHDRAGGEVRRQAGRRVACYPPRSRARAAAQRSSRCARDFGLANRPWSSTH